jgi:branched-chain amino acid aminotransferase
MISLTGYFRGRFLPVKEIAMPLTDAGFLWGATVIDRFRTFGGRLHRLDAHLDRFTESCRLAKIPLPANHFELKAIVEAIIAENRHVLADDEDQAILMFATPGESRPNAGPTLGVIASRTDQPKIRAIATAGLKLRSVHAPLGVDPHMKHRSRLPWWIASRSVLENHPDCEPLYVGPEPKPVVLETTTANVLAVIDGVVTSPKGSDCLEGIALQTTWDLCEQLGIPFVERDLPLAELQRASEILATNSTYCLANVVEVDGQAFAVDGPITNSLKRAWWVLLGFDAHAAASADGLPQGRAE